MSYRSLTLALVAVSWVGSAAASPLYTVTDLGTLGGNFSQGIGINNLGQVTGVTQTPSSPPGIGFISSNGTMTNLGTLGGNAGTAGLAINNAGQVTGYSVTAGGAQRAFIWSNGTMTNLGTLPGAPFSQGRAINNAGQVVGDSAQGSVQGFIWSNGTMTGLGSLAGQGSNAYGINNAGQVTGQSTAADGNQHAYVWTNGTMTDLGTLGTFIGQSASVGRAINDQGQIAGASIGAGGAQHAVLWSGGAIRDLGVVSGKHAAVAIDLNAAGQVVGASDDIAFLWQNGVMTDLNALIAPGAGWSLEEADGINDVGQITGVGVIGGREHAFLLTLIPEPATFGLFGVGLLCVGLTMRARRPRV